MKARFRKRGSITLLVIASILAIPVIALVAGRPAGAADSTEAGASQPAAGPKGPETITSGVPSAIGLTPAEEAKLAVSGPVTATEPETKLKETMTVAGGPQGLTEPERAKLAANPPVEIPSTICLPLNGEEQRTIGDLPSALTPVEVKKLEADRAALRLAESPAKCEPEVITVGPPDAPQDMTEQEKAKLGVILPPPGPPVAPDSTGGQP
jgi:hypothetical protein